MMKLRATEESPPLSNSSFMKKIRLYDYQQEMLGKIIDILTADGRQYVYEKGRKKAATANSVMVQMPTGTGKTYVMASVVKWYLDSHPEGEVWIIAHRRELVEQMQQTLDRFCLAYGGKELSLVAKVRIRVMSIQWLSIHMGDMQGKPGLIMVDEAHHAIADTYQNMFEHNRQALRVGMTATPCRMKRTSFAKVFARIIESPSTKNFIMRGYLAPYDYVVTGKYSADQMAVNQLKGRGSDGDYAVREMDEKLNIPQAIRRLFDSVRTYASGRKGIVYAIDIAHAKAIAECYNALGLRSVALDSNTPSGTRRRMVEAFRRGELDCLVNVNLFDEGFDCPDVEFIQMARPTLSLAKYLQMVGRGLRINKDDKDKVCMIIDNVGNYRKFGLPDSSRDWVSMFAGLKDGKGIVPPYVGKLSSIAVTDDEMLMVKKADTHRSGMSPRQLRIYLQDVRPFVSDGLYGLCVADDIILSPMYRRITQFYGDYAAFCIVDKKYGLLDRSGKIAVMPEYRGIAYLGDNSFRLTKQNKDTEVVNLSFL